VMPSVNLTNDSVSGSSPAARILKRTAAGEMGSALVEMALVTPILLLLVTGIFAFSLALYQKMEVAEALSASGRVLALERSQADPCTDAANAFYAAAPSLAKSKITLQITLGATSSGIITGGTSYPSTATAGTSPTCTAAGLGGAAPLQAGWGGKLTATYPCVLGIYGPSFGNCNIASQITEVIQ
jgi:Flp pilus assembly protein TadG